MAKKWKKSSYPGVRYREHETRKNGVNFDRYFAIRYYLNGKRVEEGIGWASDGWDAESAAIERGRIKRAQKLGEGPYTLAEKRELNDAQREAEEKRKEQEKKDALTFAEFWKKHYIGLATTNKTERTVGAENTYFKNWIDPSIGGKPIKKIAPLDLERIKKKMLDAGRAPRSIQYCLAIIRQVFNHARNMDLYKGDPPTAKVKAPKFDNKRLRFLTYEEADKLLAALKKKRGQLHDIALLSLHCGLRASEIFRLKWSAVNLDLRTLTIKDTKGGPNRTAYILYSGKILKNS